MKNDGNYKWIESIYVGSIGIVIEDGGESAGQRFGPDVVVGRRAPRSATAAITTTAGVADGGVVQLVVDRGAVSD
jgi:hypothetical protein